MRKLLFCIYMTLILPLSANAGVVGGGGNTMTINSDQMLLLEQNLTEPHFVRIKSLNMPVRSLQDFRTFDGKRGIVVETMKGIPLILMEKEFDHSERHFEE